MEAPSWSGPEMQVGQVVETRLRCFVYFRVRNRQGYHVATLRLLYKHTLRHLMAAIDSFGNSKTVRWYSRLDCYIATFFQSF